MHLIQIPPDKVINGESPLETMWPMIEPLLQRAVDYSHDTVTLEEVTGDLISKRKQLWVIVGEDKQIRAAAVSMLQKFTTGLTLASVTLLGGEPGHLDAVLGFTPDFEKWAKDEGCNRVRFHLRKGWVNKLPDYKLEAYIMSKSI